MPQNLNQTLLLIVMIAGVVAIGYLIRLFAQLRRTAAEGEKALAEFRELTRHLQELDLLVKQQVEELGRTITASKYAVGNVAETSSLIAAKFFQPSFKFLPFILPIAQFVWRQFGKRKKEKAYGK